LTSSLQQEQIKSFKKLEQLRRKNNLSKMKDCQAKPVKLCGIFIKHITRTRSQYFTLAGKVYGSRETLAHKKGIL